KREKSERYQSWPRGRKEHRQQTQKVSTGRPPPRQDSIPVVSRCAYLKDSVRQPDVSSAVTSSNFKSTEPQRGRQSVSRGSRRRTRSELYLTCPNGSFRYPWLLTGCLDRSRLFFG